MGVYERPGGLFCKLHCPSLLSVCMPLNVVLTFLMPFHILQYPLGHGQGFYRLFCPFMGW